MIYLLFVSFHSEPILLLQIPQVHSGLPALRFRAPEGVFHGRRLPDSGSTGGTAESSCVRELALRRRWGKHLQDYK